MVKIASQLRLGLTDRSEGIIVRLKAIALVVAVLLVGSCSSDTASTSPTTPAAPTTQGVSPEESISVFFSPERTSEFDVFLRKFGSWFLQKVDTGEIKVVHKGPGEFEPAPRDGYAELLTTQPYRQKGKAPLDFARVSVRMAAGEIAKVVGIYVRSSTRVYILDGSWVSCSNGVVADMGGDSYTWQIQDEEGGALASALLTHTTCEEPLSATDNPVILLCDHGRIVLPSLKGMCATPTHAQLQEADRAFRGLFPFFY